MARVLTDLNLVARKLDGSLWQLVAPLEYHVGGEDSIEIIIVPAGFITDGASVPWGARNLFPKDGTWTPAAAIHDYLYQYRGILPVGSFTGPTREYSRVDCDKIFDEAMGVLKVSWIKRAIMYRALRMFGMFAWHDPSNIPGRE